MYRTFVIMGLTFREAIVQPIYALLLALGATILLIFEVLPFFTMGDDTTMYKSVGLDIVLLLVLIPTLFATSKSIFDEIEDRTMLTLMSKPVRKSEVLIGKYLGIVLAALLAVVVLGVVLVLCTQHRIASGMFSPNDYLLSSNALDDRILKKISDLRWMHAMSLLPCLVLVWLQVSVLASLSVALSTRFSLVVNLPAVILLYIAGNLTRFLFPIEPNSTLLRRIIAQTVGAVLPFLQTFDIRSHSVYRAVAVPGTAFMNDPTAISLGALWSYFAVALLYAAAYATFALGIGLYLFQTRELGGAEG